MFLFADDTVMYYAHKNIEEAAEATRQHLQEIDCWMDSNELTINIRKTQYMIISGHHKKFEDTLVQKLIETSIIPSTGTVKN